MKEAEAHTSGVTAWLSKAKQEEERFSVTTRYKAVTQGRRKAPVGTCPRVVPESPERGIRRRNVQAGLPVTGPTCALLRSQAGFSVPSVLSLL